jgi:hypothetical protein
MTTALGRRIDPAVLIRRGLLALIVLGILATAFELASERHWNGIEQLIPWIALAVLTAATMLLVIPADGSVAASRVLALLVVAASLYGVVEHILVNYDSGALDQRYAQTWSSLSVLEQLWLAATKTVGPAPTLAPGVLGQSALLLLLATFTRAATRGHPRDRPFST